MTTNTNKNTKKTNTFPAKNIADFGELVPRLRGQIAARKLASTHGYA